jgi:lipid-binding SYLF domain-containing protein
MKTLIRFFSIILLITVYSSAEPAEVINAKADAAIKVFTKEVKGGREFLSKVAGYLVFPEVIKGGFILGGEYGEGVLRVQNENKAYYRMISGSIGFQAGLQKRSVIIAFISRKSLENFLKSDGWEAGVDGSIAVVNWGAGKDISSMSFEKPIVAFVFDTKGLMYNLTLEGTKFQRIIPR